LKRTVLLYIALLVADNLFAQTQKEIDYYKSTFFRYQIIGTDSALYYNNKVFASTKPIDLAFAYAAKWQLLFVTGQQYAENELTDTIAFYLKQVPAVKENYFELANIYNIMANTCIKKEAFSRASDNLLIAQNFAELNGDFKQLIKIKTNLSIVKGSLGMRLKAIEEFKQNIQLIEEHNADGDAYLEDFKNRNALNLGTFYIDEYKKGSDTVYLDSARMVFDKMLQSKLNDHLLAQVNSKLGIINNELGNFDKATAYYKNSISAYTKTGNQKEIAVIVYNMGYNLYKQKKYSEARDIFLTNIRKSSDSAADFNYLFSHKYLADIYALEKNDSAIYYTDKFIRLYTDKTELEKKALAKSYNELEKKDLNAEVVTLKNQNQQQGKLRYLLIAIITVLVAAFAFLTRLYVKNRKEAEARLNELMKKLQESKGEEKPREFSQQKVTGENERKIIEGLLKLEKEAYFLKKDFNLHNTAKKIGSNTTYLTAVIKTYKKMSFNDYTNELRINYILKELMVNEKLQNYTIQSLAEVAGYKNGASFSKIFKLKTGVTPYQFIEKLRKTNAA
jgi:YesN/AraC family two-component response regulator